MPAQTDIPPFSVTDGKVSNQAKINPSKLAPAKEGQVLIAGKDGKFAAGDLPSTTTVVDAEEEVLPPNSVKIGPVGFYDGEGNTTKKVGTGPEAIPQRDASGNLKAETADQATNATNADKLDNQDGTYYTNADNQTAGSSTSTNAGNGLTFTTQTIPFKQIVATYDFDAQGTGTGASSTTITHNFGYIPSARIYKISGSDLIEIEMYVTSTTTTTTVHFDYINFDIRIILR